MRKLFVVIITTALALPVLGKDMNGKFGVGIDQSMGGVSGINLKYFLGDFSIWLTPGLDLFAIKDGDTAVALDVALGGIYNFARSEVANLGAGLRVDFGYRNKTAGDTWQVGVEVPLVGEYFFSDHFAIHFSAAMVVHIVPETGPALRPPTPSGLVNDISSGAALKCTPVGNDGSLRCVQEKASKQGVGFSIGAAGIASSVGFTFYF